MKKKVNCETHKGKVVFSKRRILLSLFLFLIAAFIGVWIWNEAEKEKKEEKRYEEIRREKGSSGEKLTKMYEDMVGWIEIKNTTFSYPVMQTVDEPEYYLNRNEKGEYSFYGTPFLDARCTWDSDELLIYGHNINGRRFFGFLHNYGEESFYRKHKNLYFTRVNETELKYPIVAVIRTDIDSDYFKQTEIYNDEQYVEFVKEMIADSLYPCDAAEILKKEMKENTVEAFFHKYQFLTLVTCRTSEGRDKRLLVIGYREKETNECVKN
jgi:sortase B